MEGKDDQKNMEEKSRYQLRRRRLSNNPNFALNLDMGYQINEGKVADETPSPSSYKFSSKSKENLHSALQEFRNKQQSFDIQIEDCEEEEITIYSDDEAEPEKAGPSYANRPITPTPVQDFGTNVVYTEGPQATDFLKVKTIEHECYTDVSDADTDEEE
ncbi:unnamed protein product [Parnassius apollo]|uniref:(apollo) hypothetical protein n=1 Tax=Parnassius apollo TaxID=110799 RepID=A0A8S3WVJ6_PARAO|nr:unnamed protein product [Parnassius apollo]